MIRQCAAFHSPQLCGVPQAETIATLDAENLSGAAGATDCLVSPFRQIARVYTLHRDDRALSLCGPNPPDHPAMTSSELPPVHLLCNSLVDPLAIRTGPPALSWSDPDAIGSGPRSAYQILVASTTDALAANVGDVWDSGKCTDRGESEVLYEGRPLEPLSPFYWKVRTWSAAHLESSWSDVATFEVGIGGLDAWNGLWISWNDQALAFEPATEAGPVDAVGLGLTPAPYLRREFDVGEGLESARLYITARGLYEARRQRPACRRCRVGTRVDGLCDSSAVPGL